MLERQSARVHPHCTLRASEQKNTRGILTMAVAVQSRVDYSFLQTKKKEKKKMKGEKKIIIPKYATEDNAISSKVDEHQVIGECALFGGKKAWETKRVSSSNECENYTQINEDTQTCSIVAK